MKKLFILFAVLCLAAPAMAADWNFYGSARMATFWVDDDPDAVGTESDEDLNWDLQGNARIGANVKVNDQIGGGFEYGSGPNLRKLFGTYTFAGGSQLMIGQNYTPSSSLFYSNSVFDGDGDLLGRGEFYVGRVPMLQWKMGGLKVALIKPGTSGVTGDQLDDVDNELPKLEVAYGWKGDMFFFDVFGGYQTYTVDAVEEYDVDSYVVGGGVGMNLGAFYAKVGAHMGTNLGNYGAYNPSGLSDEFAVGANGEELDSDGLGYLGVIGFNASEMFTIEAGLGYEQAEPDNADEEDSVMQYYVNAVINIAPGFFIVPEVGMIQEDPAGDGPEPEIFYAGAKWQINF